MGGGGRRGGGGAGGVARFLEEVSWCRGHHGVSCLHSDVHLQHPALAPQTPPPPSGASKHNNTALLIPQLYLLPHLLTQLHTCPHLPAHLRFAAMSLVSPLKAPQHPLQQQQQQPLGPATSVTSTTSARCPPPAPVLSIAATPSSDGEWKLRSQWLSAIVARCLPALHALYEDMKLDVLK